MRRKYSLPGTSAVILLLLVLGVRTALAAQGTAAARAAAGWAIRGIDAVPMDGSGLSSDRTVVVADGVIQKIGAAGEIEIPRGFEIIDGDGRWLIPGLVDTHVHVDDADDFLLYLANGVTTVVNLRGSPQHLAWGEELARGLRLGPRMLTCGPFLRGPRLEVEEIGERVREIATQGYDCVKIYDDWGFEAYREVAAATREVDILFVGHAPREIGLGPVLEDGRQRLAHLEEVVYATPALDEWVESVAADGASRDIDPAAAVSEEVERLAKRLAEAGVWVTATEVVIDTYLERSTAEGLARLAARPSWRYLDPFRRLLWARSGEADRRRFVRQVALQHLLLRALRQEGVPMALGTDASTQSGLLVMPGWSVHEELRILVGSGGFSPWEALRQATANAFAFLERPGAGLVAEGAPADLLVLRENPLLDIEHASNIETVIVRGERFPVRELHERLETRREAWAPLEEALSEAKAVLDRDGAAAGARAYLAIAREHAEYAEEVEGLVNTLGYELLFDGRLDDAIEVLDANARAFPGSANAWDSLAEAHLENGDRQEAIRLYRRALAVDPQFSNARRMLEQLEADTKDGKPEPEA